jgi:CBS domain-containing protein
MNLRELIAKPPVTLAVDGTVEAAANLMDQHAVGAVIVLDGDRPVGIVTDRDLVVRGMARRIPPDARIDSLMSTGIVAIDATADLQHAVAVFNSHPFRRLPVVDGSQIVGMITVDDLVVACSRTLADLTTGITAQLLFGHAEAKPPVPA